MHYPGYGSGGKGNQKKRLLGHDVANAQSPFAIADAQSHWQGSPFVKTNSGGHCRGLYLLETILTKFDKEGNKVQRTIQELLDLQRMEILRRQSILQSF